ncbi:polysaccharide deacetylase family protein [Effusibacillus dendaii]|uniref:NodB homology domain-containing protein n=1 Tax=Effusibacillus dendaii TaxID=2743772 RepID=A0A7I8D5F9_9BACL|nr:polysaccharide deacetylase family protein [Effusibacillus dendaii]BCJ85315.1 hypothetical protein skT53_03000 [Effusibacillus dendaii]
MKLFSLTVSTILAAAVCTSVPLKEPAYAFQTAEALTYNQLKEIATQKKLLPVNAKISRAGKANVIPELNGLEIDVEETWNRLQQNSGYPIPYAYKQIPPQITIKDLPLLPIYQGNSAKKEMALMINVAWGTEYIPAILEELKRHAAKATFFLDGSWLLKNPDVARQIVTAGHEIGNHAFSHPDMARLSAARQLEQIEKTQTAIKNTLAVSSKWFAPPSGSYNDETVRLAKQSGMTTVLWTLDTVDWRRPPSQQIINRIVPKAVNGAMVLMHPTAPTAEALKTMIPALQQKGFRLVTVSDLLSPVRQPE